MLIKGRDFQEVLGVAKELQELGFGSHCFEELIKGLCKEGKFDAVAPVLREMQLQVSR